MEVSDPGLEEPLLVVLSVLQPWEGEGAASCGHCSRVAKASSRPLTFLLSFTRGCVLCVSPLCYVILMASDCEQDLSICLHLAHVLKGRNLQMFPVDHLRLLEKFDPLCSDHPWQSRDG